MFGGEGAYVPSPNAAPDMRLRLHEIVDVLDFGLVPHPGRALLDSGAQHHPDCSSYFRLTCLFSSKSALAIVPAVPRGNIC